MARRASHAAADMHRYATEKARFAASVAGRGPGIRKVSTFDRKRRRPHGIIAVGILEGTKLRLALAGGADKLGNRRGPGHRARRAGAVVSRCCPPWV